MTPKSRKIWQSRMGRALLGNMLNGKPLTPQDKMVAKVKEHPYVLDVSAEWLLTGCGEMARTNSLNPDQLRALNIFELLPSQEARDQWLNNDDNLLNMQKSLFSSNGNPFPGAPLASRSKPAVKEKGY